MPSSLNEYLKKNKMTQKQFAKLIGVSPTYVFMILKGMRSPSKKVAAHIEAATNGKISRMELLYPK